MFHGNMPYHPSFHENPAYATSYQPYQAKYAVGFVSNNPPTTDYQHNHHACHPPTPAHLS